MGNTEEFHRLAGWEVRQALERLGYDLDSSTEQEAVAVSNGAVTSRAERHPSAEARPRSGLRGWFARVSGGQRS